MTEIAERGYDSERGKEALRVINLAHERYAIARRADADCVRLRAASRTGPASGAGPLPGGRVVAGAADLARAPRNRTCPGYPLGYRPADLGARRPEVTT